MTYPVISLIQPYATLIALGCKGIETRSWETTHRGPILIHASLKQAPKFEDVYNRFIFDYGLGSHYVDYKKLPFGAIVGMANINSTIQFTENTPLPVGHQVTKDKMISDQEFMLGDFTPGRWGWMLTDQKLIVAPYKVRGRLSIWKLTVDEPLIFNTLQIRY